MLIEATPLHRELQCTCFPWRKKLKAAQRQIERLSQWAYVDSLTGLYNFRYLEHRLKNELRQSQQQKAPLSVLMMDLDGFGALNKKFGHHPVNQALKQVAAMLQKCVRPSDGLIRYGGDEFLALLPRTDSDAAVQTALRIQAQIHTLTLPFSERTELSLTIGIAVHPDCGQTGDGLVEAADGAMRKGKELGKNRIQVASQMPQDKK